MFMPLVFTLGPHLPNTEEHHGPLRRSLTQEKAERVADDDYSVPRMHLRRASLGAHGEQHPPHVGMDDDRVGRLVRMLGAGGTTPLQTLARVSHRALIGGLGDAQTLHADREGAIDALPESALDGKRLLLAATGTSESCK
jgi:hypothetical protein